MMYKNGDKTAYQEVIGLLPAGGKATRISPLPCSKELLPIGFYSLKHEHDLRPKVISHYLLETMRSANIRKAYIILRKGKWDIPAYFGDGKMLDMDLAYLMMNKPFGVPYTLDQAYPFVRDVVVALGFPDMIVQPDNAYKKLLTKLAESGADVVLGLFPSHNPYKTDMVELDGDGGVKSIQIKPDDTELVYAWEIAVWTPTFTQFMHNYLLSDEMTDKSTNTDNQRELFVGDVIQAAITNSMRIDSVLFEDGACIDIGTPDDMVKALQKTIPVLKEFTGDE